MLYEICKMMLIRMWLGPVVRDLFNGIYEVINGGLLFLLSLNKKKFIR